MPTHSEWHLLLKHGRGRGNSKKAYNSVTAQKVMSISEGRNNGGLDQDNGHEVRETVTGTRHRTRRLDRTWSLTGYTGERKDQDE